MRRHGAYRFIGDLLASYAANTDDTIQFPTLAPVKPQLLGVGRLPKAPCSVRLRPWAGVPAFALGYRVLFRRPVPLTPLAAHRTSMRLEDFPGFLYVLDRRGRHAIVLRRRRRRRYVNDLLLRDLLLTMHEWKRGKDPKASSGSRS